MMLVVALAIGVLALFALGMVLAFLREARADREELDLLWDSINALWAEPEQEDPPTAPDGGEGGDALQTSIPQALQAAHEAGYGQGFIDCMRIYATQRAARGAADDA